MLLQDAKGPNLTGMKKPDMPPESEPNLTLRDAGVPDLELPDAPDFISEPPHRTLSEMLPFLDEFLQWETVKNYQKPYEMCSVEFVL
jgi:hypothetical protein